MITLNDLIEDNDLYFKFYKRFGQINYKSFEYYFGKDDAYKDVKKIIEEDVKKIKNKDVLAYLVEKFDL